MHLPDGVIKGVPVLSFTMIGLGLVAYGVLEINQFIQKKNIKKNILWVSTIFILFVSLIQIPTLTGSYSHPCGSPLIAILLGPWISVTLTGITLLIQATFFDIGDLSSWGINLIAQGVGGGCFAWLTFATSRKLGAQIFTSGIFATLTGNVITYLISGLSLATFISNGSNPEYSLYKQLYLIYQAYLPTQTILMIAETFVTIIALKHLTMYRSDLLLEIGLIERRKLQT